MITTGSMACQSGRFPLPTGRIQNKTQRWKLQTGRTKSGEWFSKQNLAANIGGLCCVLNICKYCWTKYYAAGDDWFGGLGSCKTWDFDHHQWRLGKVPLWSVPNDQPWYNFTSCWKFGRTNFLGKSVWTRRSRSTSRRTLGSWYEEGGRREAGKIENLLWSARDLE